jgi:hypothetical protein
VRRLQAPDFNHGRRQQQQQQQGQHQKNDSADYADYADLSRAEPTIIPSASRVFFPAGWIDPRDPRHPRNPRALGLDL